MRSPGTSASERTHPVGSRGDRRGIQRVAIASTAARMRSVYCSRSRPRSMHEPGVDLVAEDRSRAGRARLRRAPRRGSARRCGARPTVALPPTAVATRRSRRRSRPPRRPCATAGAMRSWMSASMAIPASTRSSRVPTPRLANTSRSTSGTGSASPTTAKSTTAAQELLLRAEPGVHGLHRHAGAPGDGRDRGPRPAGLLEQRGRGGEHLGPGLSGLRAGAGRTSTAAGSGLSSSPWLAL